MFIAIFGCGYVGKRLGRRLVAAGHEVWGSARRPASLEEIRAAGIKPFELLASDRARIRELLRRADAALWLVPPDGFVEVQAEALSSKPELPLVYVSTSAVYAPVDREAWVDERGAIGPTEARGQARLTYERRFSEANAKLRIVRAAGIYGPGRTLRARLLKAAPWRAEGPASSRIHVDDLCRLLEASLQPGAPCLVNACDERPCPTLELARFTAEQLGLPRPQSSPEGFSPAGRKLRSRYRESMIGALKYPSYVEGVPASLAEEGLRTAP